MLDPNAVHVHIHPDMHTPTGTPLHAGGRSRADRGACRPLGRDRLLGLREMRARQRLLPDARAATSTRRSPAATFSPRSSPHCAPGISPASSTTAPATTPGRRPQSRLEPAQQQGRGPAGSEYQRLPLDLPELTLSPARSRAAAGTRRGLRRRRRHLPRPRRLGPGRLLLRLLPARFQNRDRPSAAYPRTVADAPGSRLHALAQSRPPRVSARGAGPGQGGPARLGIQPQRLSRNAARSNGLASGPNATCTSTTRSSLRPSETTASSGCETPPTPAP